MIRTYLEHSDIVEREPQLADYLADNISDYDKAISDAFRTLNIDIRNKGVDMRLVGVPIKFAENVLLLNNTNSYTPKPDYINRGMINFNISGIVSGGCEFTLYGSNDTDEDNDDKTWTEIDTISMDEDDEGTLHLEFFDYYTYYKLKYTGGGGVETSIFKEISLTESTYFDLHMYKAIELIYQGFERVEGDNWYAKKIEYADMYMKAFESINIYVDVDEDGEIDATEAQQDSTVINVGL